MPRHLVSSLFALGLGVAAWACDKPAPATARPPVTGVTVEQFGQLKWIVGSWRGTQVQGDQPIPAFFEEYGVVDDSTILMRGFTDSTFAHANDSSRIELRGGVVYDRGSGAGAAATGLTATEVAFTPVGASKGGFTFTQQGPDKWLATLSDTIRVRTVYAMDRVRR